MTPLELVISRLEEQGHPVRNHSARCPAHDDSNPSLSIAEGGDGRVLLICHAGCTTQAIVDALGLKMADLYVPKTNGDTPPQVKARYSYHDEVGVVLYEIERLIENGKKKFRARRPDGHGGWIYKKAMEGVRRVLYRLPTVAKAILDGSTIFICEGEKDCDNLTALGLVATTNPFGADKFTAVLAEQLHGAAEVIIIADRDAPGRAHAVDVWNKLDGHVKRRSIVEAIAPSNDVSDHLAAGHSVAELELCADDVDPQPGQDEYLTGPPIPKSEPHDAPRSTNGNGSTSSPTGTVGRSVTLTPASQIVPRRVEWVWDERIPVGALTLIGGREGIGKSTLADDIGAKITHGTLPGVYYGKPKAFIIAASEDSWDRTIVPRLMAAGADLDHVYRVNVTTPEGVDTTLSLPVDIAELERAIAEVDAGGVLLDPLLSRLAGNLDTHKDADVRKALEPLVTLADRTTAAVLGLIHVNKSSSTDPLTMLMGSRAFVAVARAVLFVMKDPDDENVRVFGMAKNNLGRSDLPTRTFTIEGVTVGESPDGPIVASRLVWGDEGKSLGDYIEAATTLGPEDRTATQEAGDWLRDYIDSKGGSAPSADVKKAALKVGHSARTLARARKKLGVVAESRDYPCQTWWTDPDKCLVDKP